MMDFALKNNDLQIKNGDIAICSTDIQAISQNISIRIKTLAGEWFLDSNQGIPYLSSFLGQKLSFRALRTIIMRELKSIPDIKEVRDFVFEEDKNNRKITIKFAVVLTSQTTISIKESIGV